MYLFELFFKTPSHLKKIKPVSIIAGNPICQDMNVDKSTWPFQQVLSDEETRDLGIQSVYMTDIDPKKTTILLK
jgi:hypothetical protein